MVMRDREHSPAFECKERSLENEVLNMILPGLLLLRGSSIIAESSNEINDPEVGELPLPIVKSRFRNYTIAQLFRAIFQFTCSFCQGNRDIYRCVARVEQVTASAMVTQKSRKGKAVTAHDPLRSARSGL